jgi:hypothetical protein
MWVNYSAARPTRPDWSLSRSSRPGCGSVPFGRRSEGANRLVIRRFAHLVSSVGLAGVYLAFTFRKGARNRGVPQSKANGDYPVDGSTSIFYLG